MDGLAVQADERISEVYVGIGHRLFIAGHDGRSGHG